MPREMRSSVLVVTLALFVAVAGGGAVATADVAAAGEEFPVTATDGTGTEVTLEEPPDEIVVTHASSAQIAHDIGAWDRVTGAPVEPFTAYLDDYDEPTDVTADGGPDVEVIVDLDPDMVIMGHVADPETAETLRDNGLTVFVEPSPTTIDDIMSTVETVGQLSGEPTGAGNTVADMEEALAAVDERTAASDRDLLVYYAMGDGWTTGPGTFQADLIERAGADNLGTAAELEAPWDTVSPETVLELDPDWIIFDDSHDEPPIAEALNETTAMQTNQTHQVDANLFNQAGPRVIQPLQSLVEAFHPAVPTDDSAVDAATPDDQATALPGFGVVVALVATALTSLVLSRRNAHR